MKLLLPLLSLAALAFISSAIPLDTTTGAVLDGTGEAFNTTSIETRAAVNDYPYKTECPGSSESDKWNFIKCQCTSFVAWRINQKLGIKFHNWYGGQHWGDAENWDTAGKKVEGVTVNKTPKVNSVAQWNDRSGHVAWVTKVDGDYVYIEDYNRVHEDYAKKKYRKSKFDNYIHFNV